MWVADIVTPWGDKRQFPVVANARDLQLFGKLEKGDTFYTYSELHSGWICLTKKSGKELQERTLDHHEKKMFDEATEIGNLEGSNAIRFVTDPAEVERIRASFSHRIMPPGLSSQRNSKRSGRIGKPRPGGSCSGTRTQTAPAVWRKTVRRVLDQLGYVESTFDPCLYYLPFLTTENPHRRRGCAGLVLLDVDDFVQGGNSRRGELMEELRKQFRFGKRRVMYRSSGEYLGRTVFQDENFEIRVSMQRYIKEKLRNITLPKDRVKDEVRVLDPNEVTLVRGAGGSLLWIGRECRPDMGAACAMSMSWSKEGPTVRNIKHINKAILELHNTSETFLRILPIKLSEGVWMVFSDASVGNEGDKSQGGFLIAYAEDRITKGELAKISINSWKSHRLRRAVKASLGSEALAMDDGLAELEWIKALFCEIVVPGTCVSDGTRYGDDETVTVVRCKDGDDPLRPLPPAFWGCWVVSPCSA